MINEESSRLDLGVPVTPNPVKAVQYLGGEEQGRLIARWLEENNVKARYRGYSPAYSSPSGETKHSGWSEAVVFVTHQFGENPEEHVIWVGAWVIHTGPHEFTVMHERTFRWVYHLVEEPNG